jgi:hypothetical protein
MPAFWRLRQEDLEFKASWATEQDPISRKKETAQFYFLT